MVKEVDLLSYWMPVLRQIKELKEIAKAEEPELRYLLEACDRTLSNLFITTADEYGISRFEKMLSIFPDDGEDLETRRFNVLIKWDDRVVYTDKELYNRLLSLCGEGKFSIDPHYDEYAIDISVEIGVKGAFDMIIALIDEMLPCNLAPTFKHFIKEQPTTPLSVGVAVSTAMRYQLTNDIKSKVSTVSTLNNAVANSVATALTITGDNTTTAVLGRATLGMMVLNTDIK